MKKLLIAAVMLLGASVAFAGDSDALKAIKKAKTYAEAEALVKQNLNSLTDAEEKAKAYNHLVDLAIADYTAQTAIMAANDVAVKAGKAPEALDTLGMYDAAYNAVVNAVECDKYDQMPNKKGEVKPKFLQANVQRVINVRLGLVNAGQAAAQKNDKAGVLKYWGTFLDTESTPFANTQSEAGFIGQVAYFTAWYAADAKDYVRADRYCDIALKDPTQETEATNLKFQVAGQNLKTRDDSLNYISMLKEFYVKHPESEPAFGTLANMYNSMNMTAEFNALINDKIAKSPNNYTAWALKGQTEMNAQKYKEAVESFKKAVAIDGTQPIVLTYLGFCMNAEAAQIENNIPAQKALYKESMGYLEKARELDPNREKANWAYPLYQCYYINYSGNDPRTLEMQKLANGE